MKKFVEKDVAENPLYHDTWKLLKKYRDVVWSLEISVQHVRAKFEIEYGTSIEEFLDSVYLAGADLNGSNIEHHAKCNERSHKMLKLLDSAVELLRTRHKNGEAYYWLLYYSFLSPQQLKNVEEIIENLRPAPAHPGHLLPHLLPQASGGHRRPQFSAVGLHLQGQSGCAGTVLPGAEIHREKGRQIIGTLRD